MFSPLIQLFHKRYGFDPTNVVALKAHASERKIFRLTGQGAVVCGVENASREENQTFIYFAEHFRKHGLHVPEILAVSDDRSSYLLEDLGDCTLYDLLQKERSAAEAFPKKIEDYYCRALDSLVEFQVTAGKTVDYSRCYQVTEFSVSSMLYDMQYFAQSFLAKVGLNFDEAMLRKEFDSFASYLSEAPREYFMYRDFQARNIMIHNNTPYFIDFQGGRKGPLQYDVVSLLYQSSAQLPEDARARLLERYQYTLAQVHPGIASETFSKYFNRFIIIRMMQVLGTYGRQGLEQGKDYFAKSIPPAVKTLCTIGLQDPELGKLSELRKILEGLAKHERYGFNP